MLKPISISVLFLVAVTAASPMTFAEERSGRTKTHARKSAAGSQKELAAQMEAMRTEMREQLAAMRQEIRDRDARIVLLEAGLHETHADTMATVDAKVDARVAEVKAAELEHAERVRADVASVKEAQAANTQEVALMRKEQESPTAIHYKGVSMTPVGFIAAESIFRTHAMSADISTPFALVPYPDSGLGHVSEWYGSARGSRFGLLFAGKAGTAKLTGYYETDFISAGSTSNNVQTNSYTLRQRQLWARVAFPSGLALTGGQMWTLATENRRGVDVRTENAPIVIDAAQHVGFTWNRQVAMRVQQTFGQHLSGAFAVEESQILFNATNAPANFFLGGSGLLLGAYNPGVTYSANVSPDLIGKFAYDTKDAHFEVGGMLRFFRDRYYPNGAASAQNDTREGGSFFVSGRTAITKYVEIGAKTTMGRGIGRYGASTLPDTTVRPDGTLAPIHGAHGIAQLIVHATPKLDLVSYAGVEYAQRTYFRATDGTLVGYAPPTMVDTGCFAETLPTSNSGFTPGTSTHCAGTTRTVRAGSLGYQYKFYTGAAGTLQHSVIYTYVQRQGWGGVGGAPLGTNNMVYTSFRYVLPQ